MELDLDFLAQCLGSLGINSKPRVLDKFNIFYGLLTDYNAKFNLTAITEPRQVIVKHFIDSLAALEFFESGQHICDIGPGGGFPSVPLKIVNGDLRFTLLEASAKKTAYLNQISADLGFQDFNSIQARAEEVARTNEFRECFDVVVARAVAPLNTLLEYALPLVKVGGIFVAYKGDAGQEITAAKKAEQLLGGKLEKIKKLELPKTFADNVDTVCQQNNTVQANAVSPKNSAKQAGKTITQSQQNRVGQGDKRCVLIYRKVKASAEKYPRNGGSIKRNPL